MTPRTITLRTPTQRQLVASYAMEAPEGTVVTFRESTRSLEQNNLLWARLTQLSNDLPWDGEKLTPNEYKDLLTACLRKQKVVRGIEGGLVFLGARTSSMSKAEMADLLTLMEAFAAERGITFKDQEIAYEYAR